MTTANTTATINVDIDQLSSIRTLYVRQLAYQNAFL